MNTGIIEINEQKLSETLSENGMNKNESQGTEFWIFSYLIKKEVTDGPLKNQLWM